MRSLCRGLPFQFIPSFVHEKLDSRSAKFLFEYKQLLKYFIKTIVATFFQKKEKKKKKIAMVDNYYILDKLSLVINLVVV